MKEEVKRLAPKREILRQLYTLSGNQCAFPNCTNPMFDQRGNFVGEICHIEAASEGGERFNSNMTNEERRYYDNLLLMCQPCHIETDKIDIYPTSVMKKIKKDHETMCSNWVDQNINKMYSSFQDVTTKTQSKDVLSLVDLHTTVFAKDYRSKDEILEEVNFFNESINIFRKMSPEAINLFKIAFLRSSTDKSKLQWGLGDMIIYFCPDELQRTTRLNNHQFKSILDELIRNEFISYDEDENLFFINFKNYEINYWYYMKIYANIKAVNFDYIFNNFDFTCFD